MIEYIVLQNPDHRIIKKACELLDKDGIVVIPTDTNWVMTARYDSKKAIERMYRLKGESKTHHFSLLCRDISMATEVAIISDSSFRYIKPLIPGHYTFILEAQHKLTKLLSASRNDKQVGIRFVPSKLVSELLQNYGHPLISTNLTHDMLAIDDTTDIYGHLIDKQFAHAVDLIIDPGEYDFSGQSTVISLVNGEIEVVRVGAGPVP